MTTNSAQTSIFSISRSLIIAGVLLGVAMTLKLLAPDHISPDLARRMMGVLMGMVVLIYANAVPKALSPLIQIRCDPIEEQAIRRFTGWTLVLGGAGYAAAWVIAPMQYAKTVAAILLGAALLQVIARAAWGMMKGSRA